MSFFKFLTCFVLGGILFFAGPYIGILVVGGFVEMFGAWGLVVGFVIICWIAWGLLNLLFKC